MADPKTSKANPASLVQFDVLWSHYPSKDPCVNPTTRTKAYDNQCAIRVGMALEKSGVNFATFKGPRCEFGPRANGMVLRAQELAIWLNTRPFPGCPQPLRFSGKGFQKNLAARKGIVFFRTTGFAQERSNQPATISIYGTWTD